MKVSIISLSGQSLDVEIPDGATVEDLKLKIAYSQQIGLDQIKLLFKTKPLTDGTLACYGIQDGEHIHMVVSDPVNIRVSVQLPDGNTVNVDVLPSDQVKHVKEVVQRRHGGKYGFKVNEIEFVFEGKVLEGSLNHYGVKSGSTLLLRLKTINITVTTLNQKRIEMEISRTETVETLKTRLRTETNFLENQQKLICNGRELTTGRLGDCGVGSGSIVNMVGRLRGG